jgi:hypothetical protein
MNELTRVATLQAMGIECYFPRRQLPGAAPSRRLAVVRRPPPTQPAAKVAEQGEPAGPRARDQGAALPQRPRPERVGGAPASPAAKPAGGARPRIVAEPFSLAVLVAGRWLWLEEPAGRELGQEQLQLVQAMARALGQTGSVAEVSRFDWPMHSNPQLDQSDEAAGCAAAAFISRKLEQYRCQALVLLGARARGRVPLAQLGGATVVATAGTAEMLADPWLKRQVWQDLQPLRCPA